MAALQFGQALACNSTMNGDMLLFSVRDFTGDLEHAKRVDVCNDTVDHARLAPFQQRGGKAFGHGEWLTYIYQHDFAQNLNSLRRTIMGLILAPFL